MPKISFGIIALNALPFLEYNLRALYPFAHEIVVVEGATVAAKSLARPDGHSSDGTLEMLQAFQARHDPEGKLQIVTAQQDGYAQGFWPEKEEMSQAYAKRISGGWLWQVDSDEFYLEEDMQAIRGQLDEDPSISGMSFPYMEFFGSFHSYVTGAWHQYEQSECYRLFRWGEGYKYITHRPPTVLNAAGEDLRIGNWVSSPKNGTRPIFLYHYSYVLPKQARQKVGYYSNVSWTKAFQNNQSWFDQKYMRLRATMHLGEKPGLQWLEPYLGMHPRQINALIDDLESGALKEDQRRSDDIDQLLSSKRYQIQKWIARGWLKFYWPIRVAWKQLRAKLLLLLKKLEMGEQ